MARTKNPKKISSDATATVVATPAAIPVAEASAPEITKPEPIKSTRKPTIVRSERATLVPINVDEEIRRLAYLFSERRGFEPGHETEDWLAAEHEVRQRYHQQSA